MLILYINLERYLCLSYIDKGSLFVLLPKTKLTPLPNIFGLPPAYKAWSNTTPPPIIPPPTAVQPTLQQ